MICHGVSDKDCNIGRIPVIWQFLCLIPVLVMVTACGNKEYNHFIRKYGNTGIDSGTCNYTQYDDDFPNMSGVWREYPVNNEFVVELKALKGDGKCRFILSLAASSSFGGPDNGNPEIMMEIPFSELDQLFINGIGKGRHVDLMIEVAKKNNWTTTKSNNLGTTYYQKKPNIWITYPTKNNKSDSPQRKIRDSRSN